MTSAYPLCELLTDHAARNLPASRRATFKRACGEWSDSERADVEREVARTVAASGRSIEQCLRDLDAFNSLPADTGNDDWYDKPQAFTSMHLDALLPGFARRRLACTRAQMLDEAGAVSDVLEVGSGSGRLAAMLARDRPRWRFTLVDRSPHAVHFAAALHEACGTEVRVRCVRGDLDRLPAASASMDVAIAAEVLEHAPRPERSIRELHRVLRPGGRLVVSVPIALDIAMHPTVFASENDIIDFFRACRFSVSQREVVAPEPAMDAIAGVFPDFKGCLNAVFRKQQA